MQILNNQSPHNAITYFVTTARLHDYTNAVNYKSIKIKGLNLIFGSNIS